MYYQHPSQELNLLFNDKPYQGANPADAEYLFVGLDANYDKNIEDSPIFKQLIEYLKDGVKFWNEHGVHHPFLLPSYKSDGRFYHKNFSRIGFGKKNAASISFAEILHVPTYGRSALVISDLDELHLEKLNNWIVKGSSKYIFIPTSVARLMKESGKFSWMPIRPGDNGQHLKLWADLGNKKVFWHYHFSVYGKFEAEKINQLNEIQNLLR